MVARDPTNSWAVDSLAAVLSQHGEALARSSDGAHRARACPEFEEAGRQWDLLKSRNAFQPYSAEAYKLTQSRVSACKAHGSAR